MKIAPDQCRTLPNTKGEDGSLESDDDLFGILYS